MSDPGVGGGSIAPARLAKTTRPVARDAMARPRLFRLLDRGRLRPLTWVSGPPGAGKTTLVASYVAARRLRCLWYHVDEGDEDVASVFYYLRQALPRRGHPLPLLTPEYLPELGVYARRFFRQAFARLRPPFVVVLDNYQTVTTGARLHDILVTAVENLPTGGRLVLVSREAPPAAFARLAASQAVAGVDWEDLRLEDAEARPLVRRLTGGRVSPAGARRLVDLAQGWAGGLVLLAAPLGAPRGHPDGSATATAPPRVVFDYFARQVFSTLDGAAQRVLLSTAFLPRTTAAMAGALTGVAGAGKILDGLVDSGYFTTVRPGPEPVYQYHDLFRDFLRAHARTVLAPAERADLQDRAAALLVDAGQYAAAASLYRDAANWDGLATLVEGRAAEMLTQGRGQTVQEWLAAIPPARVAPSPWLLYWRGVCQMPSTVARAREDFQRSLPRFRAAADATGAFLAWAAAADTYAHEGRDASPLDQWIPLLDDLLREFRAFPSEAVEQQVVTSMFGALMFRQPHHPDMATWTERAFDVLRTSPALPLRVQIGMYLVVHHSWLGRLGPARKALDVVLSLTAAKGVPPLLALAARTAAALFEFITGDLDACRATVAVTVEQAEETGVHAWTGQLLCHGAAAALACGDLEAAGRSLAKLGPRVDPARMFDVCYYEFLEAWHALLRGDVPLAARRAERSMAATVTLGVPFVGAALRTVPALVRLAEGKPREAAAEIAPALATGRATGNALLGWVGGLIEARIALERKDEAAALRILAGALALGRAHGLVNVWGWSTEAFGPLYALARARGIETDYVRDVIRRRGLPVGHDRRAPFGLSRREAEVLRWVSQGKRDREIAAILRISPRTVHHHLERIYAKLNVETRTAAAAIALEAAR
jgi:LuxR family maltose regulon positive regulatory protein